MHFDDKTHLIHMHMKIGKNNAAYFKKKNSLLGFYSASF